MNKVGMRCSQKEDKERIPREEDKHTFIHTENKKGLIWVGSISCVILRGTSVARQKSERSVKNTLKK